MSSSPLRSARSARPGRRRVALLAGVLGGAVVVSGLLAGPADAAASRRTPTTTPSATPSTPSSGTAAPAAPTPIGTDLSKAVADDGAKVTGETIVDSRTVDLAISSPSVGNTSVRLLLPKDWLSEPAVYWPTVYLLDGANEPQDYKSWTAYTDIESFTAGLDDLLVLPSDGLAGAYTDEWNPLNQSGHPKWETYHTRELPQIIERAYRSNGMRAVAGISIGGYGALIYSERHPGMYKAAASMSGLTNVFAPQAWVAMVYSRTQAGLSPTPWGPQLLALSNWIAHNPQSNISKLRGEALFVSSGDGSPGPLDDPNFSDLNGSRVIEAATRLMNNDFVAALKQAGIPVTADLYTGGYHYWNYWQRELHTAWPVLQNAIGQPTTTQLSKI
jgi:S-formylglutathione hydrolase FrmB